MKTRLIFFFAMIAAIILVGAFSVHESSTVSLSSTLWNVESIDTMKYSRDLSAEKLNDPTFDAVIDTQISNIAATGANYVAIDTPYDEQFYPILARWVDAARRHHLHVWFRGNFSGWEGWFNMPSIDRAAHLQRTKNFIAAHPDLFQDGDIFTACPECENGGPGDPRQTGDVDGFRRFMIDEYHATQASFAAINKHVTTNYDSMNYDVANVVMDADTTRAMGGIVVIDHYISDPDQYISNIQELAQESGGNIVLGEFGAPIPDIHGDMTETQQANWIRQTLMNFSKLPEVVGVNYWTNTGSSTELWNTGNGLPREAVTVMDDFYSYHPGFGIVKDEVGDALSGATLTSFDNKITVKTDANGAFILPYLPSGTQFTVKKDGYADTVVTFSNKDGSSSIELRKLHPSFLYLIYRVFR